MSNPHLGGGDAQGGMKLTSALQLHELTRTSVKERSCIEEVSSNVYNVELL